MRHEQERPRFKSSRLCLLVAVLFLPPAQAAEDNPRILISGADRALTNNIMAMVTLPNLGCDARPDRLNRFLPGISDNIVRASRALGYYQLRHSISFAVNESCWQLVIEVIPGDPVTVGNININIRNDQNLFGDLLDNLPLTAGAQLNQASYEQIKTALTAIAIDQGFFEARFESSQLQLDLQNNSANVVIDFNPGERFRMGELEIQRLDALSPEFISRFVDIEPGDFYSSSVLLELRNGLNNSQYFSEVTAVPALALAENRVIPINVGLQLRPQEVYSVGAGLTTDIGPRVRADYENRYLNRAGHSVLLKTAVSPVQQDLDAQYRLPMRKPTTESLFFSAGFLGENNDSFDNVTTKLATNYNFVNRYDWIQDYFISYQHEDYRLGDQHEISDLLMPGVSLKRTRADNALYPTRGWRLFGQIRGASKDVLAPETFLQLNVAGKYVHSIGPARLLVRFDVGSSLADEIADLPPSVLYFAGGDQSVRGYQYQSLGPENEAGEVIGGKHVLSAGVEVDFEVMPNWKLALFADAGNSFNNFTDYTLKTGVGFGLRWLSPIGPIRVDLASALDDDNKIRLHITMGPDL